MFPNPEKFPEQFKAWVKVVSGQDNCDLDYKNLRICDGHFTKRDRNRNNRLNALAVPSLFLYEHLAAQTASVPSVTDSLTLNQPEVFDNDQSSSVVPVKNNPIMGKCAIVSCGLMKDRNHPELTLHRLPRNKGKRNKWLNILGSENVNLDTIHTFICSKHFDESCFNRTLDVVRLRDNSVPSLYLHERPPNSPHLVKPIRIETCASCSQQIRSTTPHECPKMQVYKDQYTCLGCDQVFNGLVLFQHHVKGLHADGSLNYFFSSRNEFESWRSVLQDSISNKFIRLNTQKAKEIYHCSHQPSTISSATRLCPASITVREYLKGIHVCYYKEHFGHVIEEDIDIPLKNFNQYSITLYTKESEDLRLEAEEDNELYVQFKNMLKCIIADAAKVDSVTLKDLFGRALEMTSVLKSYHGEDHSTRLVVKNLSDDQISKSLDSLKPKQGKRKQNLEIETKNVVAKKIKKNPLSVENGVSTRLSRSGAILNKSVTFKKSIPKKNEESSDKEEETLEKDDEGTPQKSQRKKTEEKSVKKVINKAELQITEDSDVKKAEELPAPAIRSQLQSPSSFNDSYKNFVDQNFKCVTETSTPKSKVNVKKKEVVKTKMGQFKPGSPKNMSPKHTASPKSPKEVIKEVPVTPTIFKAKPDIEYIVKERENDCNILILKI